MKKRKPKRLAKQHKAVAQVEHPLLDNAEPMSESDLKKIARRGDRNELAMALRSLLRFQVGRALAAFKATERHLDDIIGEGFIALIEVADRIITEEKEEVLKTATNAVKGAIEKVLNVDINLICPSLRKQRELAKDGKDCFANIRVMDENDADMDVKEDQGDTHLVDILDALEKIEARDVIDEVILCPSYWGRTLEEIADVLGVTRQTVQFRREELYQKYLELTGENE